MVTVNGNIQTKSGFNVEQGQEIEIRIPAVKSTGIAAENIPLDIVFENMDVMVINKPAGMVVHPAAGHAVGTLVNAALSHAPEMEGISGEHRPGIVHRLDKDTSGLILIAKNDRAQRWLVEQFKERKVHKVYMALVNGTPPTPTGRVEAPIGRDPAHRKQMAIVPSGKGREAVTEYRVVEKLGQYSLVEAYPLTGRTHQVRLHLKFLGCPIVGDQLYGHKRQTIEISRQFLHAEKLRVTLPGEKDEREFVAPLPEELEQVVRKLRYMKG